MAAFTCKASEIYEILGEIAGRKAGLALKAEEIEEHVETGAIPPFGEQFVRMRYEELEAAAHSLLFRLGTLTHEDSSESPTMALLAKHWGDEKRVAIVRMITDEFVACGMQSAGGPIDITPLFVRVLREHGDIAKPLLDEFYSRLTDRLQGGILSAFRRVEWKNVEDLAALFASESISPAHGTFIDQRFIDYLSRNLDAIDGMNWRKFEALAGEYFDREGFRVELGEGRGDGGIDVRVWHADAPEGVAPLVLVQCKRHKKKIGKVIVKALWADVVHEHASSGLIVTTNALEPGAAATAVSRKYPIEVADRETLKRWLETLRTPGTGLFVG